MSNQINSSNKTGIKPAASGGSGASAKQSETKKISNGGSVFGGKVGPQGAPCYQKS
jgi:hypothetical protein